MAPPELRQPMAPHLRDYFTVISTGFGDKSDLDPEYQAAEGAIFEPDRTLAAYDDDDRIVGGTSAYSMELTVPGGGTVAAAGVTGVAVLPTHRRQGILTELMAAQFDEIARNGDAVAVLNASESHIYGRFGFGSADRATRVEIDTRHADFEWPPDPGGTLELVPATEAAPLVGEVYDAVRLRRPGGIGRSPAWWAVVLHKTASWKGGGNPFVVVHRDGDGRPDGYALYHVRSEVVDGHFAGTVECRELEGLHWEVEAALWRYLCEIDLTDTVVAWPRPIDDPVQWRLREPRRLLIRGVFDMLWVRVIDVVAALEARRYTSAGILTLDIRDQFRAQTSGVYRLEGGPDGAECRRLGDDSDDADLVMNVAELGTAYLGGVDMTTLSNAGRVDENTHGAILTADSMFSSRPAPFSSTFF